MFTIRSGESVISEQDAVWRYDYWKGHLVDNQLRIDGYGMTEIAGETIPYNPQHVYRVQYQGQGKPVEFYVSAAMSDYSSDNISSLTVKILEL